MAAADRIIDRKKVFCPFCMKEHDVDIVSVEEQTEFKEMFVTYKARFYYCGFAGEYYTDEMMLNANDISMKNAYRQLTGLLTSQEISAIRTKYGVSQSDMCTILGLGGKTIARYESHQVQNPANDKLLRKIDSDPEWFLTLLEAAQDQFTPETYQKYHDTVTSIVDKYKDFYLRKSIQACYARYIDKPACNGNQLLNLERVVDSIRYFSNSNKVKNLYKVKLMKLLWYADALSFKRRNQSITGLVYQALPMGAVPVARDYIIDLEGVVYEEELINDATAYHFIKAGDDYYPSLAREDRDILDDIIDCFGESTKKEIVDAMHKEQAYLETAPNDIIQFKYAKQLSLN